MKERSEVMRSPALSYLMSTRNKLMFLRHTLPRLVSSLQEDEEIVVVDGASTDGTTEYLRDLNAQGKIHQFLSEPDKGEAHAFNKGLLLVRGDLIKFISDDDVIHYPTIQLCKEYMLNNPEVDILGSDGGRSYYGMTEPVAVTTFGQGYEKWAQEGHPFTWCGLSIMLRRRSLPLLGLLSTTVIGIDREYTYRASVLPVCIAWCSRLSYINLANPDGGCIRFHHQLRPDADRIGQFYGVPLPPDPLWRRLTRPVRWALRPIKRMLIGSPSSSMPPVTEHLVEQALESNSVWLNKQNESRSCSFRKAVRGSSRVI